MSESLMGCLNNLLKKIDNASERALQQAGEYVEQEFKEIIQVQVYEAYSPKMYERTGAMGETPRITSLESNFIRVEFRDLGNWESVKGQPFFAMEGLEEGTTWGREETHIMEEVRSSQFQKGIGEEYKDAMITQGIPIK